MNFLYPQFLFGLFAIGIPIIIHLFNLQRPKKVLFSNVAFLKQVQQSTSKRLKLKHLLILLSRILFISFLVFMFAQPFISNKDTSVEKGRALVSFYFDNSYSMQNEVEQEKLFDIGVKSMQKVVDIFPPATSYGFLTNDFEGRDQYFRNKDKLVERITEVGYSGNYRKAPEVLERQHQSLQMQGGTNKHILWFTDFQKSTLGDLSKLNFDSSTHYHLVPIQQTATSNVSIDSVWLSSPLLKANENNTLEVILRNSGEKEVRALAVKFYIEGVQIGSSLVDINANASTKTSFSFNISGEGQKKATIKFEDYPVSFDNEYYLTLSVSPKIKILHLFENGGTSISSVYSNETIFEVTSTKKGSFDYSQIPEANLIILDGLAEIAPSLLAPLQAFVKDGGSVFIVPSSEAEEKSYTNFAQQFGFAAPEKVKADTSKVKASELKTLDFAHPFYQNVFDRKQGNIAMPFGIPIMNWRTGGDKLLSNKNDQAFLTLRNYKKGKVYLLATDLTDDLTSLHRHAIFVPIFYKMAFNSILTAERLAFDFQESSIRLDIENAKDKNNTNLYSLESKEVSMIPSQWIVGDNLMIDISTELLKAGFYTLKRDGKEEQIIALNNGKNESIMNVNSKDEIVAMVASFPNVNVYDSVNSEAFANEFYENQNGIPLWKYFLMGALLFLFVEIVLIRFL